MATEHFLAPIKSSTNVISLLQTRRRHKVLMMCDLLVFGIWSDSPQENSRIVLNYWQCMVLPQCWQQWRAYNEEHTFLKYVELGRNVSATPHGDVATRSLMFARRGSQHLSPRCNSENCYFKNCVPNLKQQQKQVFCNVSYSPKQELHNFTKINMGIEPVS